MDQATQEGMENLDFTGEVDDLLDDAEEDTLSDSADAASDDFTDEEED